MNRLIINTEFFLQCAGNCVGCFLTKQEREEKQHHGAEVKQGLIELAKNNNKIFDEVIIGIGRGNNLLLEESGLLKIVELIDFAQNSFKYKKIKFEISTSLIGKLDIMLKNAKFLLEKNKNIVFNVVINSDIISKSFWSNYNVFTSELEGVRKKWGWLDETGDILVLNINPEKLPDINLIKEVFKDRGSPLNISVFPFDKNLTVEKLEVLGNWLEDFYLKLKDKDINIKNFLNDLKNFEINTVEDIKSYHENSVQSYYFIDKNGLVTNGSLSTMGEVDYPRLKKKFEIEASLSNAIKVMNKNKGCFECDYKKECILTGAYLSVVKNNQVLIESTEISKNNEFCLSGYKKIFQLVEKKYT